MLVIVISIIIVNSCRKDIKRSDQQSIQALADNHIDIAKLQAAYKKGIGNKRQVKDISQQTLESIIGTLNVDWTTYSIFTYPDSTQVVEFAMPDDTTLLYPHTAPESDTIKYLSKTNAVFILHKDTVSMSFFMKTVEDDRTTDYQSVINYLHYQQIPVGFTGNIYYFTLSRQYINGYTWKNGAISKAISFGTSTSNPPTQTNNSTHKKRMILRLPIV